MPHADTEARMRAFHCLDRQQQAEAIGRLAIAGMSDHGIARATGLSVEMICRLLADAAGSPAENAPSADTDTPVTTEPPYGLPTAFCANCAEGD